MKNTCSRRSFLSLLAAAPLGASVMRNGEPAQAQPSPARHTILCRVLEARTIARMGVSLVIFHQARKSDGRRLGALLRANDGAEGKFQAPDGWHTATVLRLGSCFGRGLLIFPSARARLVKRQQFRLRFPELSSGSRGR